VPELPEVETTRRGIEPHVVGRRIARVGVYETRLRWPLDPHLARRLGGQRVLSVGRRAKYLLLGLERGTLVVHLGMSGSLRIAPVGEARRRHDHLELVLEGSRALRYHDPRRFGSAHYVTGDPSAHWLLAKLGVEPLSDDFDASVLKRAAHGRRAAVKSLIMDSRVVVGVGNIYACESLYLAGIHPSRPARRVSAERYAHLARAIKEVLASAIRDGGTTLRDFVNGVGEPGYFGQALRVYGRAGHGCRTCGRAVVSRVIAQRNTFFCPSCQR
jgi:formamidopyrimidine-DNA glycosylase